MEATIIYVDTTLNYTYAQTGSKRVPALTSGNECIRISTGYSATATSLKLTIYLIHLNALKTAINQLEDCITYIYILS